MLFQIFFWNNQSREIGLGLVCGNPGAPFKKCYISYALLGIKMSVSPNVADPYKQIFKSGLFGTILITI